MVGPSEIARSSRFLVSLEVTCQVNRTYTMATATENIEAAVPAAAETINSDTVVSEKARSTEADGYNQDDKTQKTAKAEKPDKGKGQKNGSDHHGLDTKT